MAPGTTVASSRPPSRATAAQSRVTRLRAKDTAAPASPARASTATSSSTSTIKTGLLARSKEGLRLVGEKMKEKERERGAGIKSKTIVSAPTTYGESLQAFLRIRPTPSDSDASVARPYLEMQGDKDVLMRAPVDTHRPNMPKPPHLYSFDRVFGPNSAQSDFFANTTLPLVDQLLKGENGLLFAYGVSNSGKTYSVSGGNTVNSADRGVLPRAIDVVFNSISGLESKASLRCQGLADVVLTDESDPAVLDGFSPDYEGTIDESIKVDRNYSYAVFVSYAEVYNEKIFDLLENVLPITPSGRIGSGSASGSQRSSQLALPGTFASSMNLAAMANGGGGVLKRKALVLKNDPEGNGKYIAGLSDVRVKTRQEALAVFRTGQRARQVFGTLANRESSRSHGIFTIKIVRVHNGAPNDPESAQVSRLAIVDLAGSERTRNTQTTGDRLKEAGNINKSLMVLGQCLEVLRANQQKMAAPTPVGGKKRLAMVPFRHSKLTEIFQNFFVGDGRAVMIVHVNPYDTGFDENSHVMRFSAIAREIQTTASNKVGFPLLKRQISTQFSALRQAVSGPMKVKVVVPVLPRPGSVATSTARLGIQQGQGQGTSTGSGGESSRRERESDGFVMVEEEIEVVEEDGSEDEEGEDETDWMVEHLFEQLKEVKQRLYESEMRNATIESEVREEAAQEMQEALQRMHADFSKMFQDQLEASESKTDRKLDILSRTIPPPTVRGSEPGDISMDADTSMEQSFESAEQSMLDSENGEGDESISDPFLMPSSTATQVSSTGLESRAPIVRRTKRVDEEDEEEDEDDTASEDNEDDEEAVIATLTPDVRDLSQSRPTPASQTLARGLLLRAEPIGMVDTSMESEDPLAAMDDLDISNPDIQADEDEESTDEEDEEEEEEEGEEDEEEDEDEEADDEDAAESSFAASASASTDSASGFDSDRIPDDSGSGSDSEDSAIGKSASRRRKTGSPVKKGQSSALPRPSTNVRNSIKPKPIAKGKATPSKVKVKSPLQEKFVQETITIDSEEEDDEIITIAAVAKTPIKKKRVLGKKVMTEDEMIAADSQVGTGVAEVRRMQRESGQFTPIRR